MDRFDFLLMKLRINHFFWIILIGKFDFAVTKMAVRATRRRRWASFELGPEGGWCLKILVETGSCYVEYIK